MKKAEIIRTLITPILEFCGVGIAFFLAYDLRRITDGIPFVQLRIPYLAEDLFIPFVLSGICVWAIVFAYAGLYTKRYDTPLIEEIRLILKYGVIWFFFYMSYIHLANGFLFQKEIPRLIIFYACIFSIVFSMMIRLARNIIYEILVEYDFVEKKMILIIEDTVKPIEIQKSKLCRYMHLKISQNEEIQLLIRERKIDAILSTQSDVSNTLIAEIIKLARIYGISFVYPKILPNTDKFTRKEGFIGNIPVIEITSVSISAWERIGKRCIDILISSILLILLFPFFILIAIIIKTEDPAGPVIFANRRIGQGGRVFSLFKFRYMYWKYSVKDAYGIDKENDEALKFEENLKQKNDTRDGPLYKIKNDPRKTRFGKILEKFSIDELPQLYNVLIGNMSLVGPRPHQPREVELYDEDDYQVLTIKPGITGMAQVYGREKNTFDEEIRLDRYYIENYSFFLDIAILMRTVGVILTRAWKK